jgi:SAM-dependent methyltransferase
VTAGPGPVPLYESPALRAAAGEFLRPGGLELTRRALSFCDLPAGARVADIGCGTGATTRYLQRSCRLEAFGLDRSPTMLGEARRFSPGLPLVRADAARLPFGDQRLSAVICECVLSLVADWNAAWGELGRVLAPGGFLLLADLYLRAPERAAASRSPGTAGCLKGAASRDEIVRRMLLSGFTLLHWEDHSAALKRLAAQLVLAGVSLQAIWGSTAAGAGTNPYFASTQRARPGYFLAIGRREGIP